MKFVLVFCFSLLCSAKVTNTSDDKPDWISMNELTVKIKSDPKPVLVDLYTNWCSWCKVMDKKTYTNHKVVSYIEDHFYAVKLDAETRESIQWNNKAYNFNDTYRVNDFTMYVTNGQPGFPTTVIFTGENSEPVSIQGFLTPKEIEPILKYFGEGTYKKQSYTEFKSTFKTTW